jgi:hypothetical protein
MPNPQQSSAINAIKQRVAKAVLNVMKEEEEHTQALLSVPVGRGAGGEVIERSVEGEHPRTETGELMGNVEGSTRLLTDAIEGILRVSRPSTPGVPLTLEEPPYNRPILAGADGSTLRLRDTAVERIARHCRGL